MLIKNRFYCATFVFLEPNNKTPEADFNQKQILTCFRLVLKENLTYNEI